MKSKLSALTPNGTERSTIRREVRRDVARQFYAGAAVAALCLAVLFMFVPTALDHASRLSLVLTMLALSVLASASIRSRALSQRALVLLTALAVTAAIVAGSAYLQWGISAPGLGLLGLLTCLVYAVAGRPAGAAMAALGAALVIGMAWAQYRQWLPAHGAESTLEALALRTLIHLGVITAGLGGGAMVVRVTSRYLATTEEREQRFRGLLAIATDAYWEIDAQYRLLTFKRHGGEDAAPEGIGQLPWELPPFAVDDDTLDLLRAQLEARESIRDLPVRWAEPGAGERHYLISGEPRLTAKGAFAGYWGVARDVSDDVQARQALLATETRYLELFTRIPTPLVLHSHARVLDANAAALQLFGHDDLHSMLGQDLLAAFEGGDSRERARRRIEELSARQPGDALPVAEFRIVSRDGTRTVVRATGVRVESSAGPAVLSIFVDDAERKKAEDAVRRSEAMLSHLVATSPDVITLTDLQTNRLAMVNKTFERVVGWRAAEVEGRSSGDFGLWHRQDQRERFVAALREHGRVRDLPAEFVTKSGRVISMLVSAARFSMDRRDYVVTNARDVSESERARLEREAILENASVGIAVTRDSRFVLANPSFEQMFGWPRGALLGQQSRCVWNSDEDYRVMGESSGPALARGEQAEFEIIARRRDGSTFVAQVGAKAIDRSRPLNGGTIWIVDDITERRQVQQALARARDAAEAANRAKSAFLANTSHELRTPLNGLIGLARLAAAPDADEALRQQYLLQIGDTAQALAAIISDILDLSKIEAGRLELEAHPFDLGELLDTLQRTYGTLAEARGLALTLHVGPGVAAAVLGDALRLRQILNNYLSNALKFTERGQIRLVATRLDTQRVRFELHDTGPGIEPAVQERLFKAFTQADESTTRRYGGTGLGLSICRELATMMHGTVGVHSRSGEGSCFWVEISLPAAEDGAATSPSTVDGRTLQGARVLMVEDNPVNMLIAVALLEQWGVQVEQARDGEQAVRAVERGAAGGRPFDAVLMDVQMPLMSGHEATRVLRQTHDAQSLPIIALTAAALVSEREHALAAGMNDFLTKPIDATRLQATLQRWIHRPSG